MKILLGVILLFVGSFTAQADETVTKLICVPTDQIGRTIYPAKTRALFADKKNVGEFIKKTDPLFLRRFVLTDLDKDEPMMKTIFDHPHTYEQRVQVIKRTSDEIVVTYVKGIETAMITLWIKEKKAVYFYSETAGDLSAYVAAYDCG